MHFPHHREGVGNVQDVGLPPRPAAIGVEVDGAAPVDEAPADDVVILNCPGGDSLRA